MIGSLRTALHAFTWRGSCILITCPLASDSPPGQPDNFNNLLSMVPSHHKLILITDDFTSKGSNALRNKALFAFKIGIPSNIPHNLQLSTVWLLVSFTYPYWFLYYLLIFVSRLRPKKVLIFLITYVISFSQVLFHVIVCTTSHLCMSSYWRT